jgi:hypothetical protein
VACCFFLPVATGVVVAGAVAGAFVTGAAAGALSVLVTGPFAAVIGPLAVVVVVVVVVGRVTNTWYTVLLTMNWPHCAPLALSAPPPVGRGLVGLPGVGTPTPDPGIPTPDPDPGIVAVPGMVGTPTPDSGIGLAVSGIGLVVVGMPVPGRGIVPAKPAGGLPTIAGRSSVVPSDGTGKPFWMRHRRTPSGNGTVVTGTAGVEPLDGSAGFGLKSARAADGVTSTPAMAAPAAKRRL